MNAKKKLMANAVTFAIFKAELTVNSHSILARHDHNLIVTFFNKKYY